MTMLSDLVLATVFAVVCSVSGVAGDTTSWNGGFMSNALELTTPDWDCSLKQKPPGTAAQWCMTAKVHQGESKMCQWLVKVYTGIKERADTDDPVKIQIFWDDYWTLYYRLDTYRDDFEWGQTDMFDFSSKCLAPDKIKVKLWGDDDWFFDKIEMQRKDDMKAIYRFPCNCWLDDSAHKYINVSVANNPGMCAWVAQTWTGTRLNSSTDAKVFIMMVDNGEKTDYTHLNATSRGLRSGAKGEFHFNSRCMNPKMLLIKLDGSNDWFMERIDLTKTDKMGNWKRFVFPCFCWLRKDREQEVHELHRECEWLVKASTGIKKHADTDDRVGISMFWGGTWTIYYRLDTDRDDFKWGKTDMFNFSSKCMAPDKIKVKLWGDDGWFFKKIELQRKDDMKTIYRFPCNCWLDDSTKKSIIVNVANNPGMCTWVADVWTGTYPHSSTDSKVIIKMVGNGEKSDDIHLNAKSRDLMLGGKDQFVFNSTCMTPKKMLIKLDGSNNWFMEQIDIFRKDTMGNVKRFVFPCFCRLHKGWEQEVHEIQGESAMCGWLVKVYTGIKKHADTDGRVGIRMFWNGTWTIYHKLDTNRDDLEWGKTDMFEFKSKCMAPGKIKVKLWGDDGWFFEKIELQRKDYMKKIYRFPCNCWLDDSTHKYINVNVVNDPGMCMWVAEVWTGTYPHSSTDAKVIILMVGDGETSDYIHLNAKSRDLRSGAKDEFPFNSSCMTPKKLLITLGQSNDWFMERINIWRTDKMGNWKKIVFPCFCWLRKGKEQEVHAIGYNDPVSYKWHVYLWMVRSTHLETPAKIYIRLISSRERTSFYVLNYPHRKMAPDTKAEYSLTTRCFIPTKVQIRTVTYDTLNITEIELMRKENKTKIYYTFHCYKCLMKQPGIKTFEAL